MGVPVKPLGFHVYEVAPTALNVAELPIHIIVGLLVAVIVGPETMDTDTVLVAVHDPNNPVTV